MSFVASVPLWFNLYDHRCNFEIAFCQEFLSRQFGAPALCSTWRPTHRGCHTVFLT